MRFRSALARSVIAPLALTLGALGLLPAAADTPSDDPVVHGLRGDYYLQSAPGAFDFHELKATSLDTSLDFDNLEPRLQSATGRSDDVSVRWTGRITPERTGGHTFSIIGDNGFRLWIDGRPVIDHWVDDWDKEQTSAPIELTAGRAYDIKVEYFEHYGGSNLRLSWTPPGAAKTPVPASAFRLPADFDYDGPLSSAVQPDGRTLLMDFARPLTTPPADLPTHLTAVIGGAAWPLGHARLDPADPSRLLLTLKEPVVGRGGEAVVRYDGKGGLSSDKGAIGPYLAIGANHSTYQLTTPWADDVSADNSHPEYPRPQLTRDQWRNLNGTWQFAAAEDGQSPPFGQRLAERILVPYPVESKLSGLERHEDRMWYRRTFTVPAGWKVGEGKRLRLNFDAVDWQARVYVNGKQVADHRGGYDRFSADVTDALRPGRTQELIVGVYDPTDAPGGENPPMGKQRLDPSGIFYTASSGIWQTVWMEPVATDHIDTLKLTPDVPGQTLSADVRGVRDGVPVTATAYDGSRPVGTATGRTGSPLSVPVPSPHLWSPDDPHLYRLKVTVGQDRVESYFGMRSVAVKEVAGKRRTLLNGKPVFSMATLDQGFWPDGLHTAPTDEALAYDLKMHKRMGFNAVRKHIKVEPDRWFYWADRLGLMVWQDMPAMNTVAPLEPAQREYEHEMKRMIDQHISSPSVVMWVTFNEGWGQYGGPEVPALAKSWDPTRLINGASGWNDTGNGDIADIHAYPGPGEPRPDANRAGVTGEYGGLGLAVPGHAWPVQHTYVGVDKEDYTDEYLNLLDKVRRQVACHGSSGAVYTQITDVEGELNGLLTYDRRETKPDVDRLRRAHQSLIRAAEDPTTMECAG
ncbi:PA14 domain-containing protein [Streptomyces sp. NPDC005271]|uniref:PA14 domain-containing protein n=1 Tax=unclassified Streptomyces TaxID=2593676 RepID=UPI0033BCF57F